VEATHLIQLQISIACKHSSTEYAVEATHLIQLQISIALKHSSTEDVMEATHLIGEVGLEKPVEVGDLTEVGHGVPAGNDDGDLVTNVLLPEGLEQEGHHWVLC
jgi:hypothetical protein